MPRFHVLLSFSRLLEVLWAPKFVFLLAPSTSKQVRAMTSTAPNTMPHIIRKWTGGTSFNKSWSPVEMGGQRSLKIRLRNKNVVRYSKRPELGV